MAKKRKKSAFLDAKKGVPAGARNQSGAQVVFQQTKKGVGGGKQYNLPRKTF
jgi:hypothetical protein